jgi:hypothetical protein
MQVGLATFCCSNTLGLFHNTWPASKDLLVASFATCPGYWRCCQTSLLGLAEEGSRRLGQAELLVLPVLLVLLQYDGDLKLPTNFLIPPPAISGTSGEEPYGWPNDATVPGAPSLLPAEVVLLA